jgi:S1-C subfamily serine protease
MQRHIWIAASAIILFSYCVWGFRVSIAQDLSSVPVTAPIDTDSAGRLGDIATHAVIRLLCLDRNEVGTGFLHKSGNLITADHVVRGCANLQMVMPNATLAPVTIVATDQDHDLAIVKPSRPINVKPLEISQTNDIKIGTQVSTWGFPGGYNGLLPLLSVGYLAGIDAYQISPGKIVKKWVVNAAFNGGNSGGPLIHIETGSVFGVVSSKLAPISQDTANILSALESQHSGFTYNATTSDGKQITFTEGQLIGRVLNELRRQVQLVIGQAVLQDDLVAFLKANKIDP